MTFTNNHCCKIQINIIIIFFVTPIVKNKSTLTCYWDTRTKVKSYISIYRGQNNLVC